ncbi:2-amino-4-hydroxy-6-hydroxymethyldihydropteridine diphosphokinase [Rhodoferax sp.]|uniref:2-amino-4-hydroxy-6- hydroxymethyldihydropteridine diphosphokinase n=1 Tax=Rhodoferax sp. TaxID=50421 RepID=UPI001EB5097E|nr:2-amino-4-hydroxy-6-hydroxymethyldihydropteridine diphosphokinase [Rhodoferax sp.]MBT9506836.1 2-amino-4-hydroxy-6-hydroxymethyldihydropteridine diphosphokinase [Rhodoferax sp.]
MRDPVSAYIGLGANLREPAATVLGAMDDIAALDGVTLSRRSSLYGSAPVDSSGPDYVNAVVEVQTRLTAPQLLAQLQGIEEKSGRERPYRNAPRTLDLDLLLYGDATILSASLVVPHPRMNSRAFVLRPLAELVPERVSAASLQSVMDQAAWRL